MTKTCSSHSSSSSHVDNYMVVIVCEIFEFELGFKFFKFVHVSERRLKACEECFHKSYGANLERLTVLKVVVWVD